MFASLFNPANMDILMAQLTHEDRMPFELPWNLVQNLMVALWGGAEQGLQLRFTISDLRYVPEDAFDKIMHALYLDLSRFIVKMYGKAAYLLAGELIGRAVRRREAEQQQKGEVQPNQPKAEQVQEVQAIVAEPARDPAFVQLEQAFLPLMVQLKRWWGSDDRTYLDDVILDLGHQFQHYVDPE